MDLKEAVRRDRSREKEKQPWSPSRFAHVGGLVRRHRLREDFCRLLREMTGAGAETLIRRFRAAPKAPYEPPLFFLATPEEFPVIQEILGLAANPYLAWATDPEEMLLSARLFDIHPALLPEILRSRHFATLW